jgi:molybdenum cofactor guanylyltransferase
MPEKPEPRDWSLALLVGGRGRRLGGRHKGNLRRGGIRLIEHALALTPHFAEALLVGDEGGAYPEVAARRVADLVPGGGAPVGLWSALDAARTPLVLVAPCDAVGLSLEAAQALASALSATHDAACFVDAEGEVQPFPGLYRASAAVKLRAAYKPGTSVYALLDALIVSRVTLPNAMWAREVFANVNTWEDARALGVDDQGSQ